MLRTGGRTISEAQSFPSRLPYSYNTHIYIYILAYKTETAIRINLMNDYRPRPYPAPSSTRGVLRCSDEKFNDETRPRGPAVLSYLIFDIRVAAAAARVEAVYHVHPFPRNHSGLYRTLPGPDPFLMTILYPGTARRYPGRRRPYAYTFIYHLYSVGTQDLCRTM